MNSFEVVVTGTGGTHLSSLDVSCGEIHVTGPKHLESARLIAAAPGMLAALEQIANGYFDGMDSARCMVEMKRIAHDAIATAKGERPVAVAS